MGVRGQADPLNSAGSEEKPPGESRVRGRAVLVGLAGAGLLGLVTPFFDLWIRGTWIAACHLPIGAFLVFLVLLVGLNPLLARVGPRLRFSQADLMTSYCIMLVGACIPSFGLTEYLIPTIAGAFYFQRPELGWDKNFFGHIPQWFVPVDLTAYPNAQVSQPDWVQCLYRHLPPGLQPASPEVVRQFYEGLPGARELSAWQMLGAIPWGAWVVPLAAWSLLAGLVFFVMFCLTVILRRQWVDRERLSFPLVQLPLEMVRLPAGGAGGAAGRDPPFFRDRWMWMAASLPLVVHSVNGLHYYFPAVPEIQLFIRLNDYMTTPPWNQVGHLWLWLHFSVVGFTFLLPTDLSFSFWFFFLFYKVQGLIAAAYGATIAYAPGYPVPTYASMQMLGAFVVMVISMGVVSRGHLARLWRSATGQERGYDEGEPTSYRLALWGLGGGLLAISLLCAAAGMGFLIALLTFVLLCVIVLVLTRFVSEGGLLFIQAPFRPSDMMKTFVGGSALGVRNLTVLAYLERALPMYDLRGFLMPSLMDAWRISDGVRLRRRQLVLPLAGGILVAMAASYFSLLFLAYRKGGMAMEPWFMSVSPQMCFGILNYDVSNPVKVSALNLELVGVGGAVMGALFYCRSVFPRWPFHPIGYAMGPSWPMIQLWSSVFLGWLLKTSLLHFGGTRMFRRARPVFLGLVLGEFVAAGIWLAIDSITGVQGHRFFLT